MLRSGRAALYVQTDVADVGPAISYLMIDTSSPANTKYRNRALNYSKTDGFASSALQVVMGGFPFTAFGIRTTASWISVDGIPTMQAVWWAGGIQVTEEFAALEDGLFRRTIHLQGANIVGEEDVVLRLLLPKTAQKIAKIPGGIKGVVSEEVEVQLAATEPNAKLARRRRNALEIGPVHVVPGGRTTVETTVAVFFGVQSIPTLANATATTAQRWQNRSTVETSDALVKEMFDHARYGLASMVSSNGTMNASIFEYGLQWVRDTSNTLLGALHCGEFELARTGFAHMLANMLTREGVTMIAGNFDEPDREQLDQVGELLQALRAYRDWTGDDSLIRENRDLLRAVIERPLKSIFRDATGLMHNRREYWERTASDGYELVYQTYVILGLREAIALAEPLGAVDQIPRWQATADEILKAMLTHPTHSLVHNGCLIKRRKITGEVAFEEPTLKSEHPDCPVSTESHHSLVPDTSDSLPIVFRIIDPKSDLALRTLDNIEKLWNMRWSDGGYDRYHSSGQLDQPGPWPFATCFVMRAQHEAGLYDRSRRVLSWLRQVQGGQAGAWFEEIPSMRSTAKADGICPWANGEISLFTIRNLLGVHFVGPQMAIRPALFPGSLALTAKLRFRKDWVRITVSGAGVPVSAKVNGVNHPIASNGTVLLPEDFAGGSIEIVTSEHGQTK